MTKTRFNWFCERILRVVALFITLEAHGADKASPHAATPIAWSNLGAKADADYKGDGLAIESRPDGAQLHCVFQRLDGQISKDGLWLRSTVTTPASKPFRMIARSIGRADAKILPSTGVVKIETNLVRFVRPELTEEYSSSVDGLRQDFVIAQRPDGIGPARLELEVNGARAEAIVGGAQLLLPDSGRKLVYNRLKIWDAHNREFPARIEITSADRITVVFDDANAAYPVRVDPTFSDANWLSRSGLSGLNNFVNAVTFDSAGNLFVGGDFSAAGSVSAACVAKWDGTNWSALGTGMNNPVFALAVSGNKLYAAGYFTNAGGVAANYLAQWDGTNWSSLGSSMNGDVLALAVSGGMLYAGGAFTSAGGVPANCVARWDGTNWSALGSGITGLSINGNTFVDALALSGGTLYAGGGFSTAGGVPANSIAQWDGTNWSALGPGVSNFVYTLAVSGGKLYAGGDLFQMVNGSAIINVAKWDGTNWSTVGSGLGGSVNSLVVSGGILYAGGDFPETNGTNAANFVAQWDGTNWSPLGSGLNHPANALVVLGNTLWVGGEFTTAGNKVAIHLAEAALSGPVAIVTNNQTLGFSNALFGFDVSGPPGSNVVIQGSIDLSNWVAWQTNALDTNGLFYFSDPQTSTNLQRFYRAYTP